MFAWESDALKFRRQTMDLEKNFPHKIDHDDLAYKLFIAEGFEWGGDWEGRKDYQHFEMPSLKSL